MNRLLDEGGLAMTRVIVDAAMLSKLHNLSEPLELCDEAGRVLANVRPGIDLSQYEPLEPQVSEEELERRSRSPGPWYTTAEVLAHLKKLS
jgi:hypothetical protein